MTHSLMNKNKQYSITIQAILSLFKLHLWYLYYIKRPISLLNADNLSHKQYFL